MNDFNLALHSVDLTRLWLGFNYPFDCNCCKNWFGSFRNNLLAVFHCHGFIWRKTNFLKNKLSLARNSLQIFCVIAFIGTIFPNSASLIAASYLPGGVLSILIATVPMFAFPIALFLGIDKFEFSRVLGIIFGFLGVYLLIAPEAALPDPSVIWIIPIALIAPIFYGLEGNFVAKFGTGNNSPIEMLLGASIVGCFVTFSLAILSNQFVNPFVPWTSAHYAVVFSSIIHGIVYATYVWLVTKVGVVFSAQVSYFVTLAGVLWSMAILDEVNSKLSLIHI